MSTQEQLYDEATRLDIDGRSNMNKNELADAIRLQEPDNPHLPENQESEDEAQERTVVQRLYDDYCAGRITSDEALRSLLAVVAEADDEHQPYANEQPERQG